MSRPKTPAGNWLPEELIVEGAFTKNSAEPFIPLIRKGTVLVFEVAYDRIGSIVLILS
jgi:hypothetical protein